MCSILKSVKKKLPVLFKYKPMKGFPFTLILYTCPHKQASTKMTCKQDSNTYYSMSIYMHP